MLLFQIYGVNDQTLIKIFVILNFVIKDHHKIHQLHHTINLFITSLITLRIVIKEY